MGKIFKAILLVAFFCGACAQPKKIETGYGMERFDASGLTLSSCTDSREQMPSVTEFSHSCSWEAPDGTVYYVHKVWKR